MSVGFLQSSFILQEEGILMQLCAILRGMIERNVIVDFSTRPGSAQGRKNFQVIGMAWIVIFYLFFLQLIVITLQV